VSITYGGCITLRLSSVAVQIDSGPNEWVRNTPSIIKRT
jgi:hypothetical protein